MELVEAAQAWNEGNWSTSYRVWWIARLEKHDPLGQDWEKLIGQDPSQRKGKERD